MCKRICIWILASDLQGSIKGPKEGVKEPNCADDAPVRRACAAHQHHSHNWVVISRGNARCYGILLLGSFWTLKGEKHAGAPLCV